MGALISASIVWSLVISGLDGSHMKTVTYPTKSECRKSLALGHLIIDGKSVTQPKPDQAFIWKKTIKIPRLSKRKNHISWAEIQMFPDIFGIQRIMIRTMRGYRERLPGYSGKLHKIQKGNYWVLKPFSAEGSYRLQSVATPGYKRPTGKVRKENAKAMEDMWRIMGKKAKCVKVSATLTEAKTALEVAAKAQEVSCLCRNKSCAVKLLPILKEGIAYGDQLSAGRPPVARIAGQILLHYSRAASCLERNVMSGSYR